MSRDLTLAGYALLAVAMAVWHWRCVRLGAVVAWAGRRLPVWAWLTAFWLWLGWHVFAR